MTKVRPPLTYANALHRIAGLLGVDAMAQAVDRKPGTVYNWMNPDTPEQCPIDCAELLDLAWQEAGGDGAPIYETFGLRLDEARADRFRDGFELAQRTIASIKETGEANAALVAFAQPGASEAHRANTVREVEEAIQALTATLPFLKQGAGPDGGTGEGNSGGETP